MYEILLFIHSWMRWFVVALMIVLLFLSLAGTLRKAPWTERDSVFHWFFDQFFGYQILFGLTLWMGASPVVKAFFTNPGLALDNGIVAFWSIWHGLTMLVAFALFQMGTAKTKKALPEKKHRILCVTTALSLGVLLLAIPWPWLDWGRPLVRIFFS